MRLIGTIKDKDTGLDIDVTEQDDGSVVFAAGATIDGDGANGQFGGPPCYAPTDYQGETLDVIANAGSPGDWYGVVTDTGKEDGDPLLQEPNDPRPGAFISPTALFLRGEDNGHLPDNSSFKYVDSFTVPFIAVPPMIIHGVDDIVLGCRCIVTNSRSGQSTEAVVADKGPPNHIGEISVACARAIGVRLGKESRQRRRCSSADHSVSVVSRNRGRRQRNRLPAATLLSSHAHGVVTTDS